MQVWRGSFFPFPACLLQHHHFYVTCGHLGAAMDHQLLGVPEDALGTAPGRRLLEGEL